MAEATNHDQGGRERRRTGNDLHRQWKQAGVLCLGCSWFPEREQIADGEHQQDQSAGDAKIGGGNSDELKRCIAGEHECDADEQCESHGLECSPASLADAQVLSHADEYWHHADRIDRDKQQNNRG
jgi:hypothetical protein